MAIAKGLMERRVPHFLAVYLGAGWGFVQFLDFLEGRYSLSPHLTDVALLALGLLIPSVVLFTYNHGKPGKDAWTRSDKVGIPLNVLIAVSVLFAVFHEKDLGAVVTSVTTQDESGQTVQREVPRATYRSRLALFNFEGDAQDTAVSWLRYALPQGIEADVIQNMFIDVRPAAYFRERLRQQGLADTANVPDGLKRTIAEEQHLPFFFDGRVSRDSGRIVVQTALYMTSRGEPVREHRYGGSDVFQLIDRISADLKDDLGSPPNVNVRDVPVSEIMTSSPAAFRRYAEGIRAIQTRDQWPEGARLLEEAVQLDPTFAFAWYALHNITCCPIRARGPCRRCRRRWIISTTCQSGRSTR